MSLPKGAGLLIKHPENAFKRGVFLRVPPGREAIISRGGVFSSVLREGDEHKLGGRLFKAKAEVYIFDIQPAPALKWGMGGLEFNGRVYGMNGDIQIKVSSSRMFLEDNIGKPLPVTAQKAFEGALELFKDIMRECAREIHARVGEAALIANPALIVDAAEDKLDERLNERGLALHALFVNEFAALGDAAEVNA